MVERHYALIPQRAGRIVVRGPSFMGQMLSSTRADPFDSFFGEGTPVQARADDVTLDARAAPANTGTPWLPARSVQLRLTGLPQDGRVKAGEPLTLTLSIDATGTSAEHLPEPRLPPLQGARVYPDQTQDATRDDGRWLHASRTRSFAIVPNRGATLTIPAITLDWWNVARDRAEQARLPVHALTVIGGAVGAAPPAAAGKPSASAAGAPSVDRDGESVAAAWRDIAIASVALWLIVLTAFAWWWFARRANPAGKASESAADARRGSLRKRVQEAAMRGDAAACERALLEWARGERPGIRHLGALRESLGEPTQREALDRLQHARWNDGDAAAACDSVAKAFARGLSWREAASGNSGRNGLPPLYPQSR